MRADEPDPDVQRILDQVESAGVTPLAQYGADRAREIVKQMRPEAEGPEIGDVTERTIPGFDDSAEIPVRIYRPDQAGPFPAIVFFHGGGFVIGDLESHDLLCRHVVRESGCAVLAVDYRRAPEHPFPAAVEDAYAAIEWVDDDPVALDADGQLAVMGDSSGGNLAAAVSLMARDWDGPVIDYQALVYPAVSPEIDWPSFEENGEGYYLTLTDIEWFDECYFGSRVHYANPYAFPLVASRHGSLPPATVITAGFDPLRDEGKAYADALQEAGVEVTYRNYEGMIHGFLTMLAEPVALDTGHEAVSALGDDLRGALH